MDVYLPRIVDKELTERLSYAGAVAIRGLKWCGKTATAEQQAKSAVFMQNPDELEENMLLAKTKPSLLLSGEKPRLIDEWQEVPQLWDVVRFAVDRSPEPGQYLLTGSATPGAKPRHSGAGRFSLMDMRTMTLYESGDSTGEVSLRELFEQPRQSTGEPIAAGNDVAGHSGKDVEDAAFLICRGGWPRAVTLADDRLSLKIARDYVAVIAEEDVSRVDKVSRNPQHAHVIMQAYARCTATQASLGTVRGNLRARGSELSKDTVDSYVGALRNLYVIEDLPAWSPSLHARSRITSTPTRFFTDPSIAAAALGATPDLLLKDLSTCGLLFENLCVRDLRVYAEAMGAQVLHYRDNTGLEADAVVVLPDGRYGLFEVKMGAAFVEEGARSLKKLRDRIDSGIMGPATVCAVIVPGGYAFRRDDGVCVVPITCLAP